MDGGFVAHVSRWRAALMVLGALGFVVAAIVIMQTQGLTDPFALVTGWLGALFFGACALIGARQLLRTGPVMEVDARGILWRRWSDERIPWTAIERAEAMTLRGQHFLALWLHDPALYRSTHTLGKLAGANKAMGFGDIALSMSGTDRSFADLIAAFDRYAPKPA
jgi:prepilin signal peptidase PulO-like enzyme (type II secretory pathway)